MSAPRREPVVRIGIDFDNTLVSYDALFHRVALQQGCIPRHLPPNKLAVRDHLRQTDREDLWTEMQGYVYGARMDEAEPFPGAMEFLGWARNAGIEVFIVSHKTLHPFAGPKYDLPEAARRWIETTLRDQAGALVEPQRVFFELTKEDKVRRVREIACDFFVDDLPEILTHSGFPAQIERILFDPEGNHGDVEGITALPDWAAIRRFFEDRWKQRN